MKSRSLVHLLLVAPSLTSGYILDQSCLQPPYGNRIKTQFDFVFNRYKELETYFGRTRDQRNANQFNVHIQRCSDSLFGDGQAGDDAAASGLARVHALLQSDASRYQGTVSEVRAANRAAGGPGSLPLDDVVVYCDLDRFTQKIATPGGRRDYEYRDSAGNYVEEYKENEFVWCNQWGVGSDDDQAWTLPRDGNQPNIIQLCPAFLNYLANGGGIGKDKQAYRQILRDQTTHIPNYHWNQFPANTHPVTQAMKSTREYPAAARAAEPDRENPSMDRAEKIRSTIAHELTHTTFFASPPHPRATDIGSGDGYGWDNNVHDRNRDNSNNWGFLLECLTAVRKYQVEIDVLGMFHEFTPAAPPPVAGAKRPAKGTGGGRSRQPAPGGGVLAAAGAGP